MYSPVSHNAICIAKHGVIILCLDIGFRAVTSKGQRARDIFADSFLKKVVFKKVAGKSDLFPKFEATLSYFTSVDKDSSDAAAVSEFSYFNISFHSCLHVCKRSC